MAAGGFPQLDPSSYPSQLFWLGVAFVALYALMSKVALPGVTKVLDNRNDLREGNLVEAERMGAEAERTKVAYEAELVKAQRAAAAEIHAAEQAMAAKITAAQAQFAENQRNRLGVAEKAIEKAKADAMKNIADIAAEAAKEIAYKVAGVKG